MEPKEPWTAGFNIGSSNDALPLAVSIDMSRPRQGSTPERFDLSPTLRCGLHPLDDEGTLQVGIMQCKVVLHTVNCTVDGRSRYEWPPKPPIEKRRYSEEIVTESDAGASVQVEAGGEAAKPWLWKFGLGGKLGKSKKQRTVESAEGERSRQLVSAQANAWVVGYDSLGGFAGDLLQGGFLDEDQEGGRPLCWLSAENPRAEMSVTVAAYVPKGATKVRTSNGKVQSPEREMAERIAGLIAEKNWQRAAPKNLKPITGHHLMSFRTLRHPGGERNE